MSEEEGIVIPITNEAPRGNEKEPFSGGDMIPVFVAAVNALDGPIQDAINIALDQQTTAILLDKSNDLKTHWDEVKTVHGRVERYIKIKQERRDTYWQFVNAYNDEKQLNSRIASIGDELELDKYENTYDPDLHPKKNGLNRADATRLLQYFEFTGTKSLERLVKNNEDKGVISRGKLKGLRVETLQAALEYNQAIQLKVLKETPLPEPPEPTAPPEPDHQLTVPEQTSVIVDDEDEPADAPLPDIRSLADKLKDIRSRVKYTGHIAITAAVLAGTFAASYAIGRFQNEQQSQPWIDTNAHTISTPTSHPDVAGRGGDHIFKSNPARATSVAVAPTVTTEPTVRPQPTPEAAPIPTPELKFYEPTAAEQQAWKIVDADHPLPENFKAKTVNLKEYGLPSPKKEIYASPDIIPDLKQLITDAHAAGVDDITIGSAERTIAYQTQIYDHTPFMAVPGTSQHHTGLAIDFTAKEIGYRIDNRAGFELTKAGTFLAKNAEKYGFVQTYFKGSNQESWHFYWVGHELANLYHEMRSSGWQGDIFELQNYIAENQQPFITDTQGHLAPNPNLAQGKEYLAFVPGGKNILAQAASPHV